MRSPSKPRDDAIGVDALVLSFRTMFDEGSAGGLEATYELKIGEGRFRARVSGGRFEIVRGSAEGSPDATIEADPGSLAGLVYGSRHISEALGSGDVRMGGDRGAVERFLKLFLLPKPAATAART